MTPPRVPDAPFTDAERAECARLADELDGIEPELIRLPASRERLRLLEARALRHAATGQPVSAETIAAILTNEVLDRADDASIAEANRASGGKAFDLDGFFDGWRSVLVPELAARLTVPMPDRTVIDEAVAAMDAMMKYVHLRNGATASDAALDRIEDVRIRFRLARDKLAALARPEGTP